MVMRTMLFAASVGFAVSAPLANCLSAADDSKTNGAFYDLACLYGDSDRDGDLTRREVLDFNLDTLLPDVGGDGRRKSFRFLGFCPFSDHELSSYFYFSESRDRDIQTVPGHYSMTFANDPSGKGAVSHPLAFVDSYPYKGGHFYKAKISGYEAVKDSNGDCHLSAVSLDSVGALTMSVDLRSFQLDFNLDDPLSRPARFTTERTHRIEGAVDMMLATTGTLTASYSHIFGIPLFSSASVQSALEIPYFFFDFADGFSPDDIISVDWRCEWQTFRQTHYLESKHGNNNVPADGWPGIYHGKYNDAQGSLKWQKDSRNYNDRVELGETVTMVKKTIAGSTEVNQVDRFNGGWLRTEYKPRKYSIPNIVSMSKIDQDFSYDQSVIDRGDKSSDSYAQEAGKKAVKEFLVGSDHRKYSWAYSLNGGFERKVLDQSMLDSRVRTWIGGTFGMPLLQSEDIGLFRSVTECHQPLDGSTVTLAMEVQEKDERYSVLVTQKHGESVRDIHVIGLPAPTLHDFVINDLMDIHQWVFWAVAAVLALLLVSVFSLLFRPAARAVGFVLRLLAVIVYFPFWLIRVAIAKAEKRKAPELWFWKR